VNLCEALADPRARLGVGVAGLLATSGAVHRDRLGPAASRWPPSPWSGWPVSTWALISRSTSRAERRWDSLPTRRPD